MLSAAITTLAAGLRILRTNDEPPKGEENTYDLPEGEDLAAALRRWFRKQREEILAAIPDTDLPARLPPLADYDDAMSSAMTPLLSVYWDDSGKQTFERLGLDQAEWKVHSPYLHDKIRTAAFKFSASTNSTTSAKLDEALERLRAQLFTGLIEKGDSIEQLRKRVNGIFQGMAKWKATQIAATEASRAVHAAQLEADVQSDVVAGVELLLSGDACPLCRKVATEAKQVRLGQAFAVIGHNADYSTIRHPPIHPSCQCAMVEILKPEYGGPEKVEWSETLQQPQHGLGDDYTPPAGETTPGPEPGRRDKPLRPETEQEHGRV